LGKLGRLQRDKRSPARNLLSSTIPIKHITTTTTTTTTTTSTAAI
jgi:hypothetical protein